MKPANASAALNRYVEWLRTDSLPAWDAVGFDADNGLFFERLTLEGEPDRTAGLRIRTHMRQVYTFAHAALLGMAPAEAALAKAKRGMERARSLAYAPDGRPGWAHSITRDGCITDARRDLYDHAFVLHALAWVFKATGDPTYRALIAATLAAIDELMAAPHGGWAESERHELPRRQNPHMHLFEACLALFETTGEAEHLMRADAIFALFRARFFDAEQGVLREFFGHDWQLGNGFGSGRLDPGHFMEWVWLLRRYARSSGADVEVYCATLIASGERLGFHGGFLVDEISLDGRPLVDGRRLWPQTEHIKAHLVQYEATGDRRHLQRAEEVTDRLFATYLAGPKPGLWIDRFTLDGRIAVDHVPASIPYHLFAVAAEVLRLGLAEA
jgi:mannose/cellobiose epimerase-like protein (N-acyl-D-glucosamine 2-epimerase family)